jgi:DNA-directed RNA polymerase specialized sigma24 family protein
METLSALSAGYPYSKRPADHHRLGSSVSKTLNPLNQRGPGMKTPTRAQFDASEHGKLLSRLAQRIAQLPRMPRELLAMYYHEALPVLEIARLLRSARVPDR